MASSTQDHPTVRPTTSAPPPTPSTTTFTSTSDSDLLSRLLHRLPPSLSNSVTTPLLLRRRSSLSTTTSPPVITFTDLNSSLSTTLPTISELGFFQLINHSIPSELARSAESDSVSIFNLSKDQKHRYFPRSWPLGFDDDDEDEVTGIGDSSSLFLDSSCSTDSSELELGLSSLREFTREMERVGLAVVEALTCAMGLRNPVLDDPAALSALMWISDFSSDDEMSGSGRFYPYVVGLHYQIRRQSCSVLTDSGLVSVSCETDSILITLGDIAQVWSNGKSKKVRGTPTLSTEEGGHNSSLTMSLLVTLPLESTVSPLVARAVINVEGDNDHRDDENKDVNEECNEEGLFGSFSFEDYAWRVYHERVPLKDPLDRYRNKL